MSTYIYICMLTAYLRIISVYSGQLILPTLSILILPTKSSPRMAREGCLAEQEGAPADELRAALSATEIEAIMEDHLSLIMQISMYLIAPACPCSKTVPRGRYMSYKMSQNMS